MDNLKRLYMNICNGCNLSCRHCFNESGKTAGKLLGYYEIINLIYSAKTELGVSEVRLAGGEPTQRPDLFEIIESLIKMGLAVILQTNGVFGADVRGKIISFAGKPLKLIVSLDGTETNDFLRGRESTGRTIENIAILSKHIPIRINILLSSLLKWPEIEEIAGIAEECGLSLAFNPICPLGRAQSSLMMDPDRYFDWMIRLEELRERGITIRKCFDLRGGRLYENENCPVRRGESIHVNSDGSLYPCGFLTGIEDCLLGNARDIPLKKALELAPQSCTVLSDRCRACGYLKNGICNGGCPARIYGLNRDFSAGEIYCIASYESGGIRNE